MSKSKRARSIKARSAPKPRSNPGPRKSAAPHHGARANSQAGAGAAAAAPAERGHDRHHRGIYRLAAALGAGVLCRRGAQEARAQACFREDRRRPCLPDRWRGQARSHRALHHRCPAERLIMRRRWREPAAIAAEIDRIRSLRLDALRRQWRLVFGRVPPAASEQGPAGSHDGGASAGASFWRS